MNRRLTIFAILFIFVLQNIAYSQNSPGKSQSGKTSLDNMIYADTLNPAAPSQLTAFSFLVGDWTCDVRLRQADGSFIHWSAEWIGRYILEGYAIMDQYKMLDTTGKLVVSGFNIRSFNSKTNSWNMKWFEALTSTWLDLGPQQLGGVEISESSITFKTQYAPDEIQRIKFFNISKAHFDWKADISNDNGRVWKDSDILISAHRK
jgi:hypothetical protein